MNPKVAKFVTKTSLGLAVSALIGIMIKMEHRVDDIIDEHYDDKKEQEEQDQTQ